MADVGLIEVDSHNFPNLCLMKISAYHKAKGDNVEWWNGLKHYDIVYKSKVFDDTYSTDDDFVIMADEIIRGGAQGTICKTSCRILLNTNILIMICMVLKKVLAF